MNGYKFTFLGKVIIASLAVAVCLIAVSAIAYFMRDSGPDSSASGDPSPSVSPLSPSPDSSQSPDIPPSSQPSSSHTVSPDPSVTPSAPVSPSPAVDLEGISVSVPFERGSDELPESGKNEIRDFLDGYDSGMDLFIMIEGSAEPGEGATPADRTDLSLRRAQAAEYYLRVNQVPGQSIAVVASSSAAGVEPGVRLSYVARGEK